MQTLMKLKSQLPFSKKSEPKGTAVILQHPSAVKKKVSAFTPPGIVAGSRQIGSGRAIEVAYYAVAGALDVDAVKFVYVERNGWVHFIGADSKEFVNAPGGALTTELVRALIPAKAQDGISVIAPSDFGRFAAIVRRPDDSLSVYTGSNEDAEQFVRNSGVELARDGSDDDTNLSSLPEWVGFDQSQTMETKRLATLIVVGMFLGSALMTAVGIGASYLAGKNNGKIANFRVHAENAIRNAAVELGATGRQNAMVLDEFQRLATMAIEAQGKVLRFVATEGRVIGWVVEVPEYTPAPVYERFGVERAERQNGKLVLSKGHTK